MIPQAASFLGIIGSDTAALDQVSGGVRANRVAIRFGARREDGISGDIAGGELFGAVAELEFGIFVAQEYVGRLPGFVVARDREGRR